MRGNRDALTFAANTTKVLLFYNLFIQLYVTAIRIAGPWNQKARQWTAGRKNLFEDLEKKIAKNDRIIWFHCASAGELEQGKPVIEQLKKEFPTHRMLVSFFSPSGFSVAKKYPYADIITYLPADTRKNARRFIELVNPELVIFIKYEFWYHHMAAAAFRHIPLLLVSAIFRKEQVFFRWYGKFFRQMLFLFRHIFVQDEMSLQFLKQVNIPHASIAGDTRFDRVIRIIEKFEPIPLIQQFVNGYKCIIAGSTWKEDETMLKDALASGNEKIKLIIAPHEIHKTHLNETAAIFPGAVYFSTLSENKPENIKADVLVIDNIGMLSRLYAYATISYIGGGFNRSGIHNTLEAAVYGKPVCFGPQYKKFREARDLISCGGAFSFTNAAELKLKMEELLHNPEKIKAAGDASKNYVTGQTGATKTIINFIQENRLLTS